MISVHPDIAPGGKYTPTQASQKLEVHKTTLWRDARAGKLKYSVNRSGRMRFKGVDLITYWKTK